MLIRRIILLIIVICSISKNEPVLAERIKCGQYKPVSEGDDKRVDDQAKVGELPFVADIVVTQHGEANKNTSINCSGAIITRSQVLTSIQCLGEQHLKNSYIVRVGNNNQFEGRSLEVDKDKIYFVETNGREPDCGEPQVRQGLAILTLKEKLVYTLGERSINRICLRKGDAFFGIEMGQKLNLTGWLFNKRELKLLSLSPTVCPDISQPDLVCRLQQDSKEVPFWLQEGAPLFYNYSKNRWALVGIHTGNFDPWILSCKESKPTSLLAFIRLNSGIYREWLKSRLVV